MLAWQAALEVERVACPLHATRRTFPYIRDGPTTRERHCR
jgi:hypothetical protein